jgi:hypothetical protein
MFSNSTKGKAKEIRLDPPPLDGYDDHDDHDDHDNHDDHDDHDDHNDHDEHNDHNDHMPGAIDVSDGESYNSDFGSGYSEAGLDDMASLSGEDDGYRGGFSAKGSLDDQSSIIDDDEFAHGASSNSNSSHRSTPAETSTRPRGRVRFSLGPAQRSFARLRKAAPGATGPTSSKALCVVRTIMPNYTTRQFYYIASFFRFATSSQPITMDIVLFPPVETRVLQSSKLGGIPTSVQETRIKPTLRYVLANALHTQFH